MKSRILVMPGIVHHKVTEPPRLVRVSVSDSRRKRGSSAIRAMRYVAIALALSALVWAIALFAIL